MVDNLKSAVLQRLAGIAPVFNPRFVDFARHHGFEVVACNVRRANEKGRVESGVGYVKKNFLRGLQLSDLSAVQASSRVWLDTIANVRTHGETQRRRICSPKSVLTVPLAVVADIKQRGRMIEIAPWRVLVERGQLGE
jgi:transposase